MKTLSDELLAHPFFADLDPGYLRLISECGQNTVFKPDQLIASEGSDADAFYVLRKGRVAIQVHATPNRTALVQTLNGGDILGWSWLFPPYRWSFEARAVQTVRALSSWMANACGKNVKLIRTWVTS